MDLSSITQMPKPPAVNVFQVRLLTSRRFPTVERKLQRLQGHSVESTNKPERRPRDRVLGATFFGDRIVQLAGSSLAVLIYGFLWAILQHLKTVHSGLNRVSFQPIE